mgnify:CR=1 FL=1
MPPSRPTSPQPLNQVLGCGLSLAGMKGYFLRHRVCEEHSKAPVLIIGGAPSRLCQQCSKFHHVNAFEGAKRCGFAAWRAKLLMGALVEGRERGVAVNKYRLSA